MDRLERPGRIAGYGLALVLLGLLGLQYATAPRETLEHLAGLDWRNYGTATRTWLDGGGWYLERQLGGPYEIRPGDVLYPPTWLLLFVPAALAPWPAWWLVPGTITVVVIARLRPSPLGVATIAAFLAWPPTAVHLLTGNPGIWLVAALAAAMHLRWPAAFLLTKVTVAPLALVGIRDRRWWMTAGALVAASLVVLPMWPDYVRVLLDARHPAGILYSAQDLPMLLVPLVARATSKPARPRTEPSPSA